MVISGQLRGTSGLSGLRSDGKAADRDGTWPSISGQNRGQMNICTDEISCASAPTVSLLDDETKLVTSRLGNDRFRVAGTAEFNGYNRDIRADRIRPLVDWVNDKWTRYILHA